MEAKANTLLDDIRQENLAVYRSSSQRLREDVGQEAQIAQDYRGRLIYELLQNADDAIEISDLEAKVCFRLTDDSLWVANSGRTLDEADIRGLCGISASSKRIQGKKRASIGHKGMGFKSVLEISDSPEVYSDIACFRFSPTDALRAIQPLIDGKIVDPVRHAPICRFPYAFDANQLIWQEFRDAGYRTAFRFPFRAGDKAEQYLNVRKALESLPVSSLLFLKRLKEVKVELPHANSTVSKSWLVTRSRNSGNTNVAVGAMTDSGVYKVDLTDGADQSYSFLVAYDSDIAIGEHRGGLSEFAWDGLEVTEAAVAARVSDAGLVELPKDWRLLHVFLPSAEPCPYDLLISAAFNSNLSRQQIKVDVRESDYNQWLLANAARLFRDQLIPVLRKRGVQTADIVRLLRRRQDDAKVEKHAANAVHAAFRLALDEFPLVPAGSELSIPVSRCVVPPLVSDMKVGRTFRSLLAPSAKHGDKVFPSEQFCGSDLARVLVDHGAYELNVEEAADHLANADPSRSMLDSHPSEKVFVDPVLSVLEKLWLGLDAVSRARLETVVRHLPLFPVAESNGQITRIRTNDVECFYPPRSLKGGVGLSGLCFLMQELCWWELSPSERNDLLSKEMAIWQSLFELREFKFPDVMRASVLPALDLESEATDSRRIKLRSSDVLAAVCQLAGRMPDSTKPLPYERLGPNRALFNLSRLDVPCRSDNAIEPKWVPAYRAYLGEDWVGEASFEKVCKALVAVGETSPDVNFLIGPSYFAGLLDRFRHLEEAESNEPDDEGKDEVSLDEDEEAALDSDEQGRWLTFFRWLGVNLSLRAIHFHDVEDRASGWLTTRNLQKPSGLAFQRIPAEKWGAFVSDVRTKIEIDSSGTAESRPYFYQLHDLEHIVQILEVAARDATAAVGRAFYEHMCRNWASLERFSSLEIAVVPGEPKRRAKPPRAYDEEIQELDQSNFWIYRLRSAPVCPTGHGPREPSQVWLPTQEVIRRFGRKGRDGTACLLPTVDLPADILRVRARGLMQAIGVREELSPASFSETDAMVVIARLQTIFGRQVEEGDDLRQELRETIRPAYRNVLELLGGGGSNTSDGRLRNAPLLVNDGSGKLNFKTAADVFYLDRRDTRDRLRTTNPLWTFVLEAERGGKNTLIDRFGCRVLEESLRWMPSVEGDEFSAADKATWQSHLRELAPYILARVGADRVEETQLRRDAARLRRLVFSLEPVSRIRLKCTLDGQELFLNAVEREAFVDESSPDGRMTAFVRWGEAIWPPTEDDADALATAFGEVLGPGYFESFLALIRSPLAKREHLLKRAGAPTDVAERRFLLFEDNVLADDTATQSEAPRQDEPKTVTSKPDSENPAEQPLGTGAVGDHPKQSPLYSQNEILVDGVPIQLFGTTAPPSGPTKTDNRGDSNNASDDQNGDGENGRGYGGHTDLDRLNALGMAIVMSYELSRLRKAGALEVTMFDPEHEGPQPNAVVFDVSSPSRIAVARARCSHFDSAFRKLVEAHGVPAEWPGFDVITLSPDNKVDPDRLIELKSSGVCARVQDMSWNEWKSARSNQIRQRFYLYLVGNLRTDLNGSVPFVRTIRDPFEQLMAEVLVNRRTERKVQLAVHQFQEAEHLDLTVVKPTKHQE